MRVHFVVHESFESPAAIEEWATIHKYPASFTRLHAGDHFPIQVDYDLLVIMGGPQSPATTREECPHFDSKGEVAEILGAIDRGKSVLGICLGAQFISYALGGGFERSPNREIGVYPISLSAAGKDDPILAGIPATLNVGHWHGDMPGLPPGSAVLAESLGCPRQIIRFRPGVYGFQCHMEFTLSAIKEMIKHSQLELETFCDLPYVQTAVEISSFDYSEMNRYLFDILDRLVEQRRMFKS